MTVFIVQKQMRLDQETGQLVPRFKSLDKASRWGELVYVLSPSAHPFNPENVIGDIHDKLKDYSENDHLLLIGNPALIGMATAVAANNAGGSVRLLQWSGRHSDYTEIVVRLF